jgi:hypothetical protein
MSLSWAHTIIQKLKRLERHDKNDIRAILEYISRTTDIDWENDPFNVLAWLKRKLPGYEEDIAMNTSIYMDRLRKDIFGP